MADCNIRVFKKRPGAYSPGNVRLSAARKDGNESVIMRFRLTDSTGLFIDESISIDVEMSPDQARDLASDVLGRVEYLEEEDDEQNY